MTTHRKQLEEKLWAAAEQLRANGSLKLNEITEPILGLIFLKFADVRFKRAKVKIEPYHGRIFDPACGSGGMFVQSARFVAEHLRNSKQVMEEVAIFGQEKGEANMRVAKMNLAIHGLSGKIALVNSFYEDPFESVGKFDFVLANPPFNVKGKDKNGQMTIDPARLHGDPRYYLGLPLTGKNEISNANYLWMQMFASALSEQGRAGFVMANSASDTGNAEKEIRKKMIEEGTVDVIISVGTNMFLNASLSCTLWFFDKRKHGTDRQNKILFINAQDIYTEIDRAHSTWTDAQIQEIAAIVRRYRGEGGYEKYENIKGRCKVVTLDDVRANDYSLNPGRYVEIVEKELSDVDFDVRMKELMGEFTSLTKEAHGLEQKIMEDWKKIM